LKLFDYGGTFKIFAFKLQVAEGVEPVTLGTLKYEDSETIPPHDGSAAQRTASTRPDTILSKAQTLLPSQISRRTGSILPGSVPPSQISRQPGSVPLGSVPPSQISRQPGSVPLGSVLPKSSQIGGDDYDDYLRRPKHEKSTHDEEYAPKYLKYKHKYFNLKGGLN